MDESLVRTLLRTRLEPPPPPPPPREAEETAAASDAEATSISVVAAAATAFGRKEAAEEARDGAGAPGVKEDTLDGVSARDEEAFCCGGASDVGEDVEASLLVLLLLLARGRLRWTSEEVCEQESTASGKRQKFCCDFHCEHLGL